MDWIEKLLGLDLDGGDGSAETMIVLACVNSGGGSSLESHSFRERVRNPVRRWSTLSTVPVKCDQQRNVLGFTETRGRATRD